MRKQTKLVAVLSAAALLAMGASMTSFAAGWQKDDEGTWHYYDKEDDMIADEWKKDGSKWFYLDDDGNMLVDQWVDDDYYVGEDGAMLVNAWKKAMPNGDNDDPDNDSEHWYYFGSKGKKTVDTNKKINGKTYYFNEDGEMRYGWYGDGGTEVAYYLGEEDDGARKENQWLWLEKSGMNEDEDDDDLEAVLGCTEDNDDCDDEGWYWFGSSGKVEHGNKKKKINGKYYLFNNHGQMLYEWINNTNVKRGSNAQLDDTNGFPAGDATAGDMLYYNAAEEGWRANGWYQIDGSKDAGTDGDNDWYYVDDGEIEHADGGDRDSKDFATYDDDGAVFVKRIKVAGKYFAFNEKGQMQTGLQYSKRDKAFYYFDENGYQKTGKLASIECDDDDYTFYFNTKNGKNGQGYKGIKDDYLYFNGKRLQADDDYKLFLLDGDVYLVNKSGKIQKSQKSYDIENRGLAEKDKVEVTFKGKTVETVNGKKVTEYIGEMATAYNTLTDQEKKADFMTSDEHVISMPFIQLYDDDVFAYTTFEYNDDTKKIKCEDGWLYLNIDKNK